MLRVFTVLVLFTLFNLFQYRQTSPNPSFNYIFPLQVVCFTKRNELRCNLCPIYLRDYVQMHPNWEVSKPLEFYWSAKTVQLASPQAGHLFPDPRFQPHPAEKSAYENAHKNLCTRQQFLTETLVQRCHRQQRLHTYKESYIVKHCPLIIGDVQGNNKCYENISFVSFRPL